jgi:hypothetical protein
VNGEGLMNAESFVNLLTFFIYFFAEYKENLYPLGRPDD